MISPYPTVVRVYKLHSKAAIYLLYKVESTRSAFATQVSGSKSLNLAIKYQKQATRWLINNILPKSINPLMIPSLMPKYDSILAVYVLFLIFRLALDILSSLINL